MQPQKSFYAEIAEIADGVDCARSRHGVVTRFLGCSPPRIPGPDTAAIPTLDSGRAAHVPEPIMFLRRSSGSLFVRAEG